jgi:hypothetical protein
MHGCVALARDSTVTLQSGSREADEKKATLVLPAALHNGDDGAPSNP